MESCHTYFFRNGGIALASASIDAYGVLLLAVIHIEVDTNIVNY
jgi:hypothetical protein